MRVSTALWQPDSNTAPDLTALPADAGLVLYFGSRAALARHQPYPALRATCPTALILGCSTGGEIMDDEVHDGAIAAAAIRFNHTPLSHGSVMLPANGSSFEAGQALAQQLEADDLAGLFVLSDGTHINGSELIAGLQSVLGKNIIITGGLAGDGADFAETWVGLNEVAAPGRIAAIGFRGKAIRLGHGSFGGWDAFGPIRSITRSEGNVLYELDGKPVLPLYKSYLGPEAQNLPGSALLFPLTIAPPGHDRERLVRTVLKVDEANGSMTFAGDVPQGWSGQLMRGNFNQLVAGAEQAALAASQRAAGIEGDRLALLISCIGRKLLMGQRVVDEAEEVKAILPDMPLIGFYSYGEIAPHKLTGRCELHNQTMTITILGEENHA
ncbi:FIST N-terminal domain-containing protein [Ferrovibrio sp.]|uniref:FIST signal transduction protein n=1 Tax=Ferrovibrio sp. TaxID=1917215 RepID=UPI001B431813|nr:FIST N-terminal domain-containing protein [Ferrovibrio sp.]MBP7062805.1 FIST C-terminal domain-containing protein [Ferrovibrio sp.]